MSDNLFNGCPVCGHKTLKPSGHVSAEGPMDMCPQCGILLNNCTLERYQETDSGWDTEEGTFPTGKAYSRMEKRARRVLEWILSNMPGRKPQDISLLDVGCSSGSFLVVARQMGFQAQGVEPAEKSSATAREHGLEVFTGYLADAHYTDGQFDVVVSFNVLEHVYTPRDFVSELYRVLKPGGLMALETCNMDSWTMQYQGGNWHMFDMKEHGGHVCFFTTKNMDLLCKQAGFTPLGVRTRNVRFVDKYRAPMLKYRVASILHEALQWPSIWLGKGHDMVGLYRKPL